MTTSHSVDPSRLKWGTWCHQTDKEIGRGDIAGSYSADRIGMNESLRRPFSFQGGLWACTGQSHEEAEAYRLSHLEVFAGEITTYGAKVADSEAARHDPNGFYHGMKVKHGGNTYVLSGPPALFISGQTAQLDLFGG